MSQYGLAQTREIGVCHRARQWWGGSQSRNRLTFFLVLLQPIQRAASVLAQSGNQGLGTIGLSLALMLTCCVILCKSPPFHRA